jgi:hypothetical protein
MIDPVVISRLYDMLKNLERMAGIESTISGGQVHPIAEDAVSERSSPTAEQIPERVDKDALVACVAECLGEGAG